MLGAILAPQGIGLELIIEDGNVAGSERAGNVAHILALLTRERQRYLIRAGFMFDLCGNWRLSRWHW
ncbi:hypothetical protein GCM10010833_25220 [Blastomonas aquatica]|uniref:Uncharacterized protein n=1 Tax=Blastomonas aquatica TaxID=1510276 RepID=A0ABQ1JH96_9SPHN|nr:hypothetical protein GCM10010833_25220 [Blastomonas aquatica]